MCNVDFKSIHELVELGKQGKKDFVEYVKSVEVEEGEMHPDWFCAISDAAEELGWDMAELSKDLGQKKKNKGEVVMEYISVLKNFNGYEAITFFADEAGGPNVRFEKDRFYAGIEELEEFELNTEIEYGEYGDAEDSIVYYTYLLETAKLRSALNLPKMESRQNIIVVKNFKQLLETKKEDIKMYLKTHDDDYAYKNKFWFELALSEKTKSEDFKYLVGEDADTFFYDLITVSLELENNTYDFAIPLPVLAKAVKIRESQIYESFFKDQNLDRNREVWI